MAASTQLKQLAVEVRACDACPALCSSRTQSVPGAGSSNADLLFIGEAPGRFGADQTGIPFTQDRSGRLLREMIDELSTEFGRPLKVYITNVVKCNPQDAEGRNRKPAMQEVVNCRAFLLREIALVRPTVIVTLGGLAAKEVLGTTEFSWWRKVARSIPVYPAKHPAYVIRGGGKERLTRDRYLARLLPVLKWLRPAPRNVLAS